MPFPPPDRPVTAQRLPVRRRLPIPKEECSVFVNVPYLPVDNGAGLKACSPEQLAAIEELAEWLDITPAELFESIGGRYIKDIPMPRKPEPMFSEIIER